MDGLTIHGDDPGIPRIASLLADPARARMVWMLIDGSTRPAGELAYAANVSAQSASAHLAKLVAGGLLDAGTQGRHRYFSIASAEAAALVEGMASLSAALRPLAAVPPRSQPPQFVYARTCYGHLAGETAVRLLDAMVKARWLTPSRRDYAVTETGEAKLSEIGVDVAAARKSRRLFARACVDLTQRRPHLGGALGDALLNLLIKRGWVQRARRSRALIITPSGEASFRRLFEAERV